MMPVTWVANELTIQVFSTNLFTDFLFFQVHREPYIIYPWLLVKIGSFERKQLKTRLALEFFFPLSLASFLQLSLLLGIGSQMSLKVF